MPPGLEQGLSPPVIEPRSLKDLPPLLPKGVIFFSPRGLIPSSLFFGGQGSGGKGKKQPVDGGRDYTAERLGRDELGEMFEFSPPSAPKVVVLNTNKPDATPPEDPAEWGTLLKPGEEYTSVGGRKAEKKKK